MLHKSGKEGVLIAKKKWVHGKEPEKPQLIFLWRNRLFNIDSFSDYESKQFHAGNILSETQETDAQQILGNHFS